MWVSGSGAGSRETFEHGSKAARLEPCATGSQERAPLAGIEADALFG